MDHELADLRQQIITLESQVSSYKTLYESQQAAINDKDALLEQFQHLNKSLQTDLEVIKKLKSENVNVSGPVGISLNPWDGDVPAGKEPEQFRMLFVGNLSFATTEDSMLEHFKKFGEVEKANIKKDTKTGKSRGFGFVVYKSCAMVDNAQNHRPHVVDSRNVDTKRALPKEDGPNSENIQRSNDLFVGGLSRDQTEEGLRAYFGKFGKITQFKMPTAPNTGKSKGFAFVSYEDYDTVDKMVLIKHHTIGGFRAEVRKKVPIEIHNNKKDKKDFSWGDKNKHDDYSIGYNSSNRPGKFSGGGNNSNYTDNAMINKRPRLDFTENQYKSIPSIVNSTFQPPPQTFSRPPPIPQNNTAQSPMPMDIQNIPNVDSAQAQALAAYFSTLAKAGGSGMNQLGQQQPTGNQSYNMLGSQVNNQPVRNNSFNPGHQQQYN